MDRQPNQSIREQLADYCTKIGKGILVSFSYPGTAPYIAVFERYSELCDFIDAHPDLSTNIIGIDRYE